MAKQNATRITCITTARTKKQTKEGAQEVASEPTSYNQGVGGGNGQGSTAGPGSRHSGAEQDAGSNLGNLPTGNEQAPARQAENLADSLVEQSGIGGRDSILNLFLRKMGLIVSKPILSIVFLLALWMTIAFLEWYTGTLVFANFDESGFWTNGRQADVGWSAFLGVFLYFLGYEFKTSTKGAIGVFIVVSFLRYLKVI